MHVVLADTVDRLAGDFDLVTLFQLGGSLFPDVLGGFRDPANVRRELRDARGTEALAWITSHSFRKTAAKILDEAALSARLVADQLGHSRPSMTQDVYMGRRAVDSQAARALEAALRESMPGAPREADGTRWRPPAR